MTRQEIEALINQFNAEVNSRAWTSARAEHDTQLIHALNEAGIDVSAVYTNKVISFSKKVTLSEDGTKLVFLKEQNCYK